MAPAPTSRWGPDFNGEGSEKLLECFSGNAAKPPEDMPRAAAGCWALLATTCSNWDLGKLTSAGAGHKKPSCMSQMPEKAVPQRSFLWENCLQEQSTRSSAPSIDKDGICSKMTSGPITSWQIDGETMERVTDYFGGLQKHCR